MDCSKKPYSACLVGYEYSFFKYCTPTFIRNVFISRFYFRCSQLGLLQTSLVITPIRQRMIRGRNIHNDDVLANLAKNSRMRIKVGLQYSFTGFLSLFFQFHNKLAKTSLEVGDDYNIPHWMNHR